MTYSTINQRGRKYFLHAKVVELRNHRQQRIYYFAPEIQDGALESVPEGFEVVENERTGLPVLRRVRAHAKASA